MNSLFLSFNSGLFTDQIILVSRNPRKVNDTDELFPSDISDLKSIGKAIAGSEVVYVTIGFEYTLKIWQKIWPSFMQEVINSCEKHNAKLVFFDNMNVYAMNSVPFMTEDAPILPPSEKGKVRKRIREMIMSEVEKEILQL